VNGVRSETKLLIKTIKFMENLIKFDDVNNKIITIRNQNVILDSDVAALYGVQTKRVNEAIRNNLDKFPEGYVFELTPNEKQEVIKICENLNTSVQSGVVENFDHPEYTLSMAHLGKTKLSPTLPKAFTEKGLYMLATILKSPTATQTTITIVEAFAKLRELTNNLAILNSIDTEVIEPEVIESTIEKTGGLFNELFFSGTPTSAETSVELNLGLAKVKRTVKSEANPNVLHNTQIIQKEIDDLKKMIAKLNERLEN